MNRSTGNYGGATMVEKDLRKQSTKAPTHLPLLEETRTSAYAPGDAIDALDPAVSSQLTTILVTEALKNASTKNVPFPQLPSSDVTLRSDDKFSPYAAVNASSCAVTAPKVTELHRSVTPWGVSPL